MTLGQQLGAILPTVNAGLNATSAVLLFTGWRAVKARRVALHRALMISAFTVSTVFLASYLTRFALTGTHRYEGDGAARLVYLALLFSHMLLAAATPPLALRALYLAWRGRIAEHRRVVRWTLPVWMYVSVTGVIAYLMLYHPWR